MRPPVRGGRRPPDADKAAPGEVLFEIVSRGNAARCAAIDVATGAEAIVVGPADASEIHLKAVALRKLRLQLSRR